MQIDSAYAEADVGNIRVGQEANFSVDAFPNRQFDGEVRQVRLNPTTQQNVVTYDVVVAVDNPENELMPGMTAYVNITVAHRKDALLVPNAALRFRPPENAPVMREKKEETGGQGKEKKNGAPTATVYVIDNDQLKPVHITTGITDNRMTEVLGGVLKAGDKVIVSDRQLSASGGSGGSSRHGRLF